MRLSLQTACIIFAVTFVHVLVIASFTPPPGVGPRDLRQSVLPQSVSPGNDGSSADLTFFVPAPAEPEIIDLPAVRREIPVDPPALSRF